MATIKKPPGVKSSKTTPAKKSVKRKVKAPAKVKRVTPTVGIEPDVNAPPNLRSDEDAALVDQQKKTLVDGLVLRKRAEKELSAEIGISTRQLFTLMEEDGDRRVRSDHGEAVMVRPESQIIDQEKLRKAVGVALWNKITTRSLDTNKLDAFIKSGEIDTETVAQCSDLMPRTPYVKVTPK